MSDRTPHTGYQHPEEWREDLNPHPDAGQNFGRAGAHDDEEMQTLYDIKLLHNAFKEQFTDDELKGIPVLPQGARLRQGAIYVDLATPDRREFTASGFIEAGRDNWFVPKKLVDYQVWNRLIGVTNPERTGQADES